MAITFERDPWGWVHPFYRKRSPLFSDWLDIDPFQPSLHLRSRMNELFDMSPLTTMPRVINKGEKFEMKLDVQQFSPQELDVKIVDNYLMVEGKHEEKQDEHGFVSRHFQRKYLLPSDVKPESITCDLSSDGVLQISAPKMIEDKTSGEKVVPIKYTGLPAITSESSKDKERKIAVAC